MEEKRKTPYRVRRTSAAEYSRVSAMLHSDIEALAVRVEALEKELKNIKNKLKRTKSEAEEE